MHTWLRALSLSLVVALSACGAGRQLVDAAKTPPTANFAFSCVDLACISSIPAPARTLPTRSSPTPGPSATARRRRAPSTPPTPTRRRVPTPSACSSSTRRGCGARPRRTITVTAPPAAPWPHASFTVSCLVARLHLHRHDHLRRRQRRSVARSGTSATARRWRRRSRGHTYAATTLTTFTASLTVTDAAGKISTNVQTSSSRRRRRRSIASAATARSRSRRRRGSRRHWSAIPARRRHRVVITAPVTQTIFADGCVDPTGMRGQAQWRRAVRREHGSCSSRSLSGTCHRRAWRSRRRSGSRGDFAQAGR